MFTVEETFAGLEVTVEGILSFVHRRRQMSTHAIPATDLLVVHGSPVETILPS